MPPPWCLEAGSGAAQMTPPVSSQLDSDSGRLPPWKSVEQTGMAVLGWLTNERISPSRGRMRCE